MITHAHTRGALTLQKHVERVQQWCWDVFDDFQITGAANGKARLMIVESLQSA